MAALDKLVEPELAVYGALAIPVLYVFFGLEYTPWILVGVALVGAYYFKQNFINKEVMEKRNTPELGPREPYIPPKQAYDFDPRTGDIVPKYPTPPPRYYPPQK